MKACSSRAFFPLGCLLLSVLSSTLFFSKLVWQPGAWAPLAHLDRSINRGLRRPNAGRCLAEPLDGCWVTVYGDMEAAEASYLWGILLADVQGECGCRVELRPRADFAADLGAGSIGCAAVLHATREVSEGEEAAMRAHDSLVRARVVLVHLSDEHDRFSLAGYNSVRVVFRNYASEESGRKSDFMYLVQEGSSSARDNDGAPLWLPLGHTASFLAQAAPVLAHPSHLRPLAWSWAGSTAGKPRRIAFLEGLRRYTQADLLSFGLLHTYDDFYDPQATLRPAEYSAWLFLSRLAPCPDGGSAEQFRVWEALSAGAVPIVSGEHPHLSYLGTLGFNVLRVRGDGWAEDVPPLLHAAALNDTFVVQLEAMQLANSVALERVLGRARQKFAVEVCAAVNVDKIVSNRSHLKGAQRNETKPMLSR